MKIYYLQFKPRQFIIHIYILRHKSKSMSLAALCVKDDVFEGVYLNFGNVECAADGGPTRIKGNAKPTNHAIKIDDEFGLKYYRKPRTNVKVWVCLDCNCRAIFKCGSKYYCREHRPELKQVPDQRRLEHRCEADSKCLHSGSRVSRQSSTDPKRVLLCTGHADAILCGKFPMPDSICGTTAKSSRYPKMIIKGKDDVFRYEDGSTFLFRLKIPSASVWKHFTNGAKLPDCKDSKKTESEKPRRDEVTRPKKRVRFAVDQDLTVDEAVALPTSSDEIKDDLEETQFEVQRISLHCQILKQEMIVDAKFDALNKLRDDFENDLKKLIF